MEYLLIFISAIFVNNIVLSQFLGICPFLPARDMQDTFFIEKTNSDDVTKNVQISSI